MKKVLSVLLAILMLTSIGSVLADEVWQCDNNFCGTLNSGKFCTECGARRGDMPQDGRKRVSLDSGNVNVGDVVTFGTYPQTESGDDDTPIEWIVLDKQNHDYLLISRLVLDARPYHSELVSVTWDNCSLRKWLNNEFYNSAFNTSEKSQVITTTVKAENAPCYNYQWQDFGEDTRDKVFLLNVNEAIKYFNDDTDRECGLSGYALSRGDDYFRWHTEYFARPSGGNAYSMWFLRSSGWWDESASYVFPDGYLLLEEEDWLEWAIGEVYYDVNQCGGIRPCLWVRVGESTSSYTKSNGNQITGTKPTATPAPKPTATPFGAGKLYVPVYKSINEKPDSKSKLKRTGGDDFLYVSYDNGWYCLLLSDGTYGYVEQSGCEVKTRAAGDYGTRTSTKTENASNTGTLTVAAGTIIRASGSTSAAALMTTDRQKTYKYENCSNGWYKLIFDDGSYGYVYYTRASVINRAPGDDGSYGIAPSSGNSGKSGGNGSGRSGSGSGGGGNTGGNSGSGSGGGSSSPVHGKVVQSYNHTKYTAATWDKHKIEKITTKVYEDGYKEDTIRSTSYAAHSWYQQDPVGQPEWRTCRVCTYDSGATAMSWYYSDIMD